MNSLRSCRKCQTQSLVSNVENKESRICPEKALQCSGNRHLTSASRVYVCVCVCIVNCHPVKRIQLDTRGCKVVVRKRYIIPAAVRQIRVTTWNVNGQPTQ